MELTYRLVVRLARMVFRILGLRFNVTGTSHVPTSGAAILASTHVSFLDFMLVGLVADPSRRHVRFLARHEVFKPRGVGRAMRAMGHIPVHRDAPAAAYLAARRQLQRGEVVGIFPEAGISSSFTVRALMPGVVALAYETGAPLIPVAIWGPQRLWTAYRRPCLRRGCPVDLVAGPPLELSGHLAADVTALGEALQRLSDQCQRSLRHRPSAGESPAWHPAHLGGSAPSPEEAARRESVPKAAVLPTWLP